VALGYFHHVAAVAQLGNVFFQDDFHLKISSSKSLPRHGGTGMTAVSRLLRGRCWFYRAANGSSAMLRARLMAEVNCLWCGVHTPVTRRGTILPRSATNCCSRRTSL